MGRTSPIFVAQPALVDTRVQYTHLFDIYVPIAAGVFALIVLVVLYAVLRGRRRPPEQAARWHEANRVELAYVCGLGAVAVALLYFTFTAEHRVDTVSAQERPGLVVDVTGSKWEWHFHYPAYGIDRYSGTVGHQELVVPADTAIRFRLQSIDVIHSFWAPELDFKKAAIPGHVNLATLDFATTGIFDGQCAEFCGTDHYLMTFTVDVVSPAAFRVWAVGAARKSGSSTA